MMFVPVELVEIDEYTGVRTILTIVCFCSDSRQFHQEISEN